MSKSAAWLVWFVTVGFFGCFFVWPIATTLHGAFFDADGRFTFEFILEVFRNEIYVEGLRNSLFLAVATTVVTGAIALPLAFVAHRFAFPGKKLFSALVLIPMILPPF